MRIGYGTAMLAAGYWFVVGVFMADALAIMLPWLVVMCLAVVADLAAGVWKSHRLGVHVSRTFAVRETVMKIVTYAAFVIFVCTLDVAAEGNSTVAKWCCVAIAAMEMCSVWSNLLRPQGVELSLRGVLKFLFRRTPLGVSDAEADEIITPASGAEGAADEARERMRADEDRKWNTRRGERRRTHSA